MANVEIYDSSDSNLSSDEYSPEEDDLMDAAVSNKPRQEGAPKRTSSTGSLKNLTLEQKEQQQQPKKEDEKHQVKAKVESEPPKPPSNPIQTQLQIRQLKRSSRSSFYFKRRSLLWLRCLRRYPDGYLRSLKYTVTRNQRYLCRSNPRRRAEVQHSVDHHASSPSRSRSRSPVSRSISQSPELICLDDTENEESPEKLEAVKRGASVTPVKCELGTVQAPPVPKLKLNEEDEAPDRVNQAVKENGSFLDEFLTLKASGGALPALINAAKAVSPQLNATSTANLSPFDLSMAMQVTQVLAQTETDSTMVKEDVPENPVVETNFKRRRSGTPTSLGEKRVKSMPAVDSDDDTLEFIMAKPTTKPESIELPQEQPQQQQRQGHSQQLQLEPQSIPMITPFLKLGPAFTLAPQEAQTVQQQPVDMANMSYSLNTPTPPSASVVEPMEISYPTIVKQKAVPNKLETTVDGSLSTPPTPTNTTNALASFSTFTAPQPPQKPRRSETVFTQTTNQAASHITPSTYMSSAHQSLPTSPTAASSTAVPPANPIIPAPTPPRQQKSYPDLTNSDANFHYRIKELYSELDTIINDKLNSLTPELQSFMDERKRIDADIKTLDKLIGQKEEETNRLIHLRCVKEELRSRLERKERVLIIKDILPMLVNKNCSTPELYEMHSMLLEEQNAPITPKYGGPSALERCINQLESSQNNLRLLRGALNLREPSSGVAQFEDAYRRRNSMPAARREMQESTFSEDHVEELPPPLLSKHSKQMLQALQSKYQHLFGGNSTPNLLTTEVRASSFPSHHHHHHSLRNSLDNHYDQETTSSLKPLYNSSPMVHGREGQPSFKRGGTIQHSNYLTDEQKRERDHDREREEIKADNKLRDNRPSMNGGGGGGGCGGGVGGIANEAERRCQHCQRYEATFMCASCQNQWYCSRDCQLRAWDSHWEHCVK